jgi:hypothetical protein
MTKLEEAIICSDHDFDLHLERIKNSDPHQLSKGIFEIMQRLAKEYCDKRHVEPWGIYYDKSNMCFKVQFEIPIA